MRAAASSADLRPTLVRSIGMAPMTSAESGAVSAVAEEVVGRGGDEHVVAPRLGDGRQQRAGCRRGCGGWPRRSPARRGRPGGRGRGSSGSASGRACAGRSRALEQQHAGHAGRVAAGPLGVVVGARAGSGGGGPRRRRGRWGPAPGRRCRRQGDGHGRRCGGAHGRPVTACAWPTALARSHRRRRRSRRGASVTSRPP